MDPRNAAEILAYLRATWPRLAQDEVADRLWLEDLSGLGYETALKAFRYLRDNEKHTPSWAVFIEAYNAKIPSTFDRAIDAPKLPPPTEEQKETVHELVHALKEHLSRRGTELDRPFRRPDPRPSSGFDPLTPMLSYDEVYDAQGNSLVRSLQKSERA